MIYGVTIVLNDCNFSLNDRTKQVKERYSFEAFYTNKAMALKEYDGHLNRVKYEQGISYGKYNLRGRCEVYKCDVTNGRIFNHGTTIKQQSI